MISLSSAFALGGGTATNFPPATKASIPAPVGSRSGCHRTDQGGLVSKFSDLCNGRHVAVNGIQRNKGFQIIGMFDRGGGNGGIETRAFGKLNG